MPAANGHRPMLRLDQVTKSYAGRLALEATSLDIGIGESVAVVGPSGSGKTTMLHLLAGVIQPDAGTVTLDGHGLAAMKPGGELAGLVGVIHQQYDLVPHLSALHNVLAGRLGQWGFLRSLVSLVSPRDRRIGLEALEQVGLGDRLRERTSRLSGGEQQRVAIARLLVQDPRVIIADEPVASLDPARAADLVRLLGRITRESNRTLVASVHSMDLGRDCFDRVIGLRKGKLQFDLPAVEVTGELFEELYRLEGLESEGVPQV